MNAFFGTNTIKVVSLIDWLNWASGYNCTDKSVFVALPMIQRGSVWKPEQIVDLWDSMLRGMPIGSLMVNTLQKDTPIRRIGRQKMERLENDGLGLLDGQQRTLTMLLGWPLPQGEESMNRRVWVDFADVSGKEQMFRLRVTTANQPFGFRRESPSVKLELSNRRKARERYFAEHGTAAAGDGDQPDKCTPDLDKSRPYSAGHSLAVNLQVLVQLWITTGKSREKWIVQVQDMLLKMDNYREVGQSDGPTQWQKYRVWDELDDGLQAGIRDRVQQFATALDRIFAMEIPLIHVEIDDDVDSIDPPLAILFKRVGTGGTRLSDEDYVYSVIKHRVPETYQLVEDLLREANIAAMLSATDIVMTTVRLTAAQHVKANGSPFPDHEHMDKSQFHSLLKEAVLAGTPSQADSKGDFLKDAFLPMLQSDASGISMLRVFRDLHALLEYKGPGNAGSDIGLPPHALPLLKRPLIQVIARWVQIAHLADRSKDLLNSRAEVLRFVLFWMFGVKDPKRASKLAFEILGKEFGPFPGRAIYQALVEQQLVVALLSPNEILTTNPDLVFTSSPHPDKPIRGWSRFAKGATEKEEFARELYQRWWHGKGSYIHPVLLWLQRDLVARFEGMPLAGNDDDTPYDYDHICAENSWSQWTGSGGTTRIIDFSAEMNAHYLIGNAIGNVRVWDSSMNRSDGAALPSVKLLLDIPDEADRKARLIDSAIHQDHVTLWKATSGAIDANHRVWNVERSRAFQQAVEARAFDLYTRFFEDLHFVEWDVDGFVNAKLKGDAP